MTEPPYPQDEYPRPRIFHTLPAGGHRVLPAQAQASRAKLAPKQAALGAGLGDIS